VLARSGVYSGQSLTGNYVASQTVATQHLSECWNRITFRQIGRFRVCVSMARFCDLTDVLRIAFVLNNALGSQCRKPPWVCGSGAFNYWRRLAPPDCQRRRRHGTVWSKVVFVLNNSGYLIERALAENPNWTYNDLAPWELCRIGDGAARAGKTGAYIDHWRQNGYAAGPRLRA
jgi:hypothetical protein